MTCQCEIYEVCKDCTPEETFSRISRERDRVLADMEARDADNRQRRLHELAARYCDSNEASRDICDPDAVKLRLFLSAFLAYVEREGRRARMFATSDNVLEFNLTTESVVIK